MTIAEQFLGNLFSLGGPPLFGAEVTEGLGLGDCCGLERGRPRKPKTLGSDANSVTGAAAGTGAGAGDGAVGLVAWRLSLGVGSSAQGQLPFAAGETFPCQALAEVVKLVRIGTTWEEVGVDEVGELGVRDIGDPL